jgi:integrase
MLKRDLTATGIPHRDEDGLVVDFHALRHTFITNLVRAGVPPKFAQTLARHGSITPTMDRYYHVEL